MSLPDDVHSFVHKQDRDVNQEQIVPHLLTDKKLKSNSCTIPVKLKMYVLQFLQLHNAPLKLLWLKYFWHYIFKTSQRAGRL